MCCVKKMQLQKILAPLKDLTSEKNLHTIDLTNSQLNLSINNSPKFTPWVWIAGTGARVWSDTWQDVITGALRFRWFCGACLAVPSTVGEEV